MFSLRTLRAQRFILTVIPTNSWSITVSFVDGTILNWRTCGSYRTEQLNEAPNLSFLWFPKVGKIDRFNPLQNLMGDFVLCHEPIIKYCLKCWQEWWKMLEIGRPWSSILAYWTEIFDIKKIYTKNTAKTEWWLLPHLV